MEQDTHNIAADPGLGGWHYQWPCLLFFLPCRHVMFAPSQFDSYVDIGDTLTLPMTVSLVFSSPQACDVCAQSVWLLCGQQLPWHCGHHVWDRPWQGPMGAAETAGLHCHLLYPVSSLDTWRRWIVAPANHWRTGLCASSIRPRNAKCCRWLIGVMHFQNIWVLYFFKLLVITDISYNGSIDNQTSVHIIYFCIWCCIAECWPPKGGWRCLMSPGVSGLSSDSSFLSPLHFSA